MHIYNPPQTIIKGKGAGAAGDLTDSPASLATFLQLLMHNFSMNSASTIDAWLTVLEKEIKDIVVSKHGVHLTEIERIIKGIVIYFYIGNNMGFNSNSVYFLWVL